MKAAPDPMALYTDSSRILGMDASLSASWSFVIASSSALVCASTAACLFFDLILGGVNFQLCKRRTRDCKGNVYNMD
jgi:hypothetical protein